MATFHVLLRHTLSAYEKASTQDRDITQNSPKGPIRQKLLVRIEQLWESAKTRSDHLEQKSTATLSGLGIAAPIVVALSAFIVKESSIAAWVRYTSLTLVMLAIGSMAMGFLAILRALSVREREELGIDSVVACQTFRKPIDAFHGRGLLYVYTKQQAINDHIADFVRAAQMFLAIAVAFVLLAGTVVVPSIAAAAGHQQRSMDPALLKLTSTMEALIERTDQTKDIRREQILQQQELESMRQELQHLLARPRGDEPVAPVQSQKPATKTSAK